MRTEPPWVDVRWQCSGCGRFLPEAAVSSEDRIDPGAYYGISSTTWGNCRRCGVVEDPRLVDVREVASVDA